MTPERHQQSPTLRGLLALFLVAGCTTVDDASLEQLGALEQQQSELATTNEELEKKADDLEEAVQALDQQREELLEDAKLTSSTKTELTRLLRQLDRLRIQSGMGSLSTTTSGNSAAATTVVTTVVPKTALEITERSYFSGPGGFMFNDSVDMEQGTISTIYTLSADTPIEPDVTSNTPSTCTVAALTPLDGSLNQYRATLTLVGTGDCSITVSYPGDNTYEPATITTTITVT